MADEGQDGTNEAMGSVLVQLNLFKQKVELKSWQAAVDQGAELSAALDSLVSEDKTVLKRVEDVQALLEQILNLIRNIEVQEQQVASGQQSPLLPELMKSLRSGMRGLIANVLDLRS